MKLADAKVGKVLRGAERALVRAYAPYSRFKMGAAVLTDCGALVPGALVENVSLGLAMCAERAALFSTVVQGLGRPEVLALVSPRTSGELTWPCGACLQVALELGGPGLLVVVSDGKGGFDQARLGDLAGRLPFKGSRSPVARRRSTPAPSRAASRKRTRP